MRLPAMQAKMDALIAHAAAQEADIERLEKLLLDPCLVPELLVPKPLEVKKRKRDQSRSKTNSGGSATIMDMRGDAVDRRKDVEKEDGRLKQVREGREGKKSSAEAAAAQLVLDFDRCPGAGNCSCGVVPCPMEKMERCSNPSCLMIKRGKCKVRACVALRKPLLLMPPQAPAFALPAPSPDEPVPECAPMLGIPQVRE